MNEKVFFVGPYPHPVTGQSIAFKEVYDNYNGFALLCDTTKFSDSKLLNTFYCLFRIPYVFLFFKFDKVYFTCTRSKFGFLKDFQLLLFCMIFNKKVINHLHGADFLDFYEKSGLLKNLIKWSYSKISVSIVLMPAMKEQFVSFPKMEIIVVPNAYPLEFDSINIDILDKKKQILYLSNIIETKGIFIFLDAIEKLLFEYQDIIVKIAGKPMSDKISNVKTVENKFNYKYSVLKIKYPERLFYLGSVEGLKKNQVLKESSIFVLPTYYKTEALPITIIEAMRFGNAVITTKHNYLGDIINESNGFLVEPKSSLDLYEKIKKLLNDENKLRIIQSNNISHAIDNYSPISFISQVNEIINA